MADHAGAGSARRRRERRLRSWWRHERMSIACALAEALHHSSGSPEFDRRRVGVAQHGAVRGQTTATRARGPATQYLTFGDDEDVPAPGERLFWPQERDLRRSPAHDEELTFDVPALQMVEQPEEVDSFFRNFVPAVAEQVIEVPKLALPVCAVHRAALPEPQLVEQLVEVPTVLSVAVLQQRTAEHVIGFPVPGRGGGSRGGLQGQSSTASAVEQTIGVDRGGLQGFLRGQSSTASAVEQTFSQALHRSLPRAPVHGRHDEWVCVIDVENDGEYYWNRWDNSTRLRLPRGVKHRWCLLPSGLKRDVVLQVDFRDLPPL